MARAKPGQRQWQGLDRNEASYNSVHNALVGIILDGVAGVSPELPGHGWRMVPLENADQYIEKGRRVLADFESQACAPGGTRGKAQQWMDRHIDELRRLVSDAEAVRAGKRPQKMTPDDYEKLRKSLGVHGASEARRDGDTIPVIFRAEKSGQFKGDVTAVFPTFPGTGPNDFVVYAHIGQHSSGTHGWYVLTRAATPAEYAPLLAELRRIYEQAPQDPMKLQVVERFTRHHDAERRKNWEAQRGGVSETRALAASDVNFQNGERIRIRVIGPKGQLADPPFWYTVTGVMSVEDVALQFTQTIQPGMFVSISDGKNSWTFQKETHGGQNAVRRTHKLPTARYREAGESRRVADFNTLDDLIAHARDELGATHVLVDDANTKLYFPRGGQHTYEEASVWRKSGYWHAQGPGARTGVHELPEEAQPIGGGRAGRRAAEASGSTGRLTPRQIQDFRNGFVEGYREGRHGETSVDGRPASPEDAEGIRLGLVAGARYRSGDSSAKTIDDAVTAWIEANGGEDDHPGHHPRAAEAPSGSRSEIDAAVASWNSGDSYRDGSLRVLVNMGLVEYNRGWKPTAAGVQAGLRMDHLAAEAPRGRLAVRDYIAVDRRGRTTAGPFKTYGDAKSAAGSADVVQFVSRGSSRATEARRHPKARRSVRRRR